MLDLVTISDPTLVAAIINWKRLQHPKSCEADLQLYNTGLGKLLDRLEAVEVSVPSADQGLKIMSNQRLLDEPLCRLQKCAE